MSVLRRVGLAVILLLCLSYASASVGDYSPKFKACVSFCEDQQCHGQFEANAPLSLRLTRWTCTDNCKYACMHDMTDYNERHGRKIRQYYGKWPFWRWAGMQEPASVIFSLLNLLPHLVGYRKIRRTLPDSHPMKGFYLTWGLFGMNAWFWSAVFHTRDLPITEKLDYFSAAAVIINALYWTIIRLFNLYPHPYPAKLTTKRPRETWKILRAVCLAVFAGHIYYLTSGPSFDYAYNTTFAIVLGLAHNFLWALYALPSSLSLLPSRFPNATKAYRPSIANKAGLFVLLTTLATSLELFDFPPWQRTIDAHALWHAATAPISYFWYQFIIEDALDPSWRNPMLRERPE